MIPDPLGGDITNLQSLNRYAYALNNPTSLVDPEGLAPCFAPLLDEKGNVAACYGAGGGTIDGFWAPGGLANALARSGMGVNAADVCPNGDCTGIRVGADGTIQRWVQPWQVCTNFGCGEKHPGYWETILKVTGNFASGAGDVLSLSGTYWIRRATGAESVVNEKSGAYLAGAVTGTAIQLSFAATSAAAAGGKYGTLFGRGGAFFNRGPVRFGWSWEGSATAGRDVIRLGIGAARGTSWWSHIPFWYP